MPQFGFGAGCLFGERIDASGSGIGPMQFGVLQNVSIDWDFTTKQLYGAYQHPVAIARAQGRITGRASFARIMGPLYSDLLFGVSWSTGKVAVGLFEAGTVPGSSTYTVTASNAATFANDLGVTYATSGIPFKRVTSPSSAGEYSVNESTGVYTFAAADASVAVVLNYEYTVSGSGKKLSLTNQLMGTTPQWRATFHNPISPGAPGAGGQSKPLTLVLNACTSSKLSMPTRIDDWTIQELDFEAFADASGAIGTLSVDE